MVKQLIKNITDDKEFGYEPVDLSFNELGKRFILKPGGTYETKLNGENIDGNRLRLIEKDKKKKVETKEDGE